MPGGPWLPLVLLRCTFRSKFSLKRVFFREARDGFKPIILYAGQPLCKNRLDIVLPSTPKGQRGESR